MGFFHAQINQIDENIFGVFDCNISRYNIEKKRRELEYSKVSFICSATDFKNGDSMIRDLFKEVEPKCIKCGKNEFKLTRMTDSQIMLECINCREPHLLDAIDEKTGSPTNLQFWSPKMEKKDRVS